MLKYKALRHLDKTENRPDNNSCVYLIEERETNKKYVLRKIEVSDDKMCEEAKNEYIKFVSEFTNVKIAQFKEYFASWSKIDAALYFCTVIPYFTNGSVNQYIYNNLVSQPEFLMEECFIKKCYATLIEILYKLHKKHITHFRIQANNVFISDDREFVLGSCAFKIERADIMRYDCNHLPPEIRVKQSINDEQLLLAADIWSLGLLLLYLTTCSLNSSQEIITQHLGDYDNQTMLEENVSTLCEQITGVHSADISQIIHYCLEYSPHDRISIEQLANLPFTQDCLSLIESPLLIELQLEDVKLTPPLPPIDQLTPTWLTEHMHMYTKNRHYQLIAMNALLHLITEDHYALNNSDMRQIRASMLEFNDNLLMQLAGAKILLICAQNDVGDDILASKPYMELICDTMLRHRDSAELFAICSLFLVTMATYDNTAEYIGDSPGLLEYLIVGVIKQHPTVDKLSRLQDACTLLWALSLHTDNIRKMTQYGLFELLISMIRCNYSDTKFILSCFNLLSCLCLDEINLEKCYYYNILKICFDALYNINSNSNNNNNNNNNDNNNNLIISTILHILSMICQIESCAIQMLENDSHYLLKSTAIIYDSYVNETNAKISLQLLQTLISYQDIKAELISYEVIGLINEITEVHNGSSEICQVSHFLITSLIN